MMGEKSKHTQHPTLSKLRQIINGHCFSCEIFFLGRAKELVDGIGNVPLKQVELYELKFQAKGFQ
jgi:hypothetical protein